MKRVLVTGATGFIGRWAIDPLVARGYEVHLTTRGSFINELPREGVFYHRLNLLELDEHSSLMRRVEPTDLLHLAWDVTHGKFWHAESNLDWVSASLSLLKSFRNVGGKRVVMAGTCAEYDWGLSECDEIGTLIAPATLYGVAKASLSSMMLSYCALHNLSSAWGRIFNLYGPGEDSRRLVPSVLDSMTKGQTVMCSHGLQERDFMHTVDAANAFVALLDSEIQGSVNIASGIPISIKAIIQLMAGVTNFGGEICYGAIPVAPNDPPKLIARVRRLTDEVKFRSSIPIAEGLSQLVTAEC